MHRLHILPSRWIAPQCLALLQALSLATPTAVAQATSGSSFEASFAGKVIGSTESISLSFPNEPGASGKQIAVIVGTEDLTANFRWISPNQLEGVFAAMPLPVGVNPLRVFQINEKNEWAEIGQAQITVAAANAPDAANNKPGTVKPSLIVGIKSQLAESHSTAAAAPVRSTYRDLTLQPGLQTEHTGTDWALKSSVNIVGSSYQPEAVNFNALGNDAPKVDIANYLVEGSFTNGAGKTSLAAGHIQTGNHPLLASGIAHRGISLGHQFNSRFEIAAAAQNGTPVVGINNITGLADNEHRMLNASAGAEILERAGALRIETTLFSGVVKPRLTTGIATLQDAEESRGWGLRAKSQNTDGSLRADIAFARSVFTPKGDSILNILPGPSTAGHAWYLDVGYDIIKNAPAFKNFPFSLGLQAKHEFASSAFKSLGSGQAGNYVADTVGLNASLGVITGQLQLGKRADNVNDDIAFLKNRANTVNLTLAAPLAQLMVAAKPPLWAPTLSYNYARNHSFADTAFIPTLQTIANLPNVEATTHGIGMNWTVNKLTFGYQLSKVFQDNQQVGLEPQDLSDLGHNITAGYQFSDTLNVNGGLGKRTSALKATGVERYNNTIQGAVNWQFGNRYTLSANLSSAKDRDTLFTIDSKVTQAQLQLLKLFDVSAFGSKMPAQWSLSYAYSNNNSLGVVVRYQTLNAALSISFF